MDSKIVEEIQLGKKIGFGQYGTVFATNSRDMIDACEWHLAQLTLIQITIPLASIV